MRTALMSLFIFLYFTLPSYGAVADQSAAPCQSEPTLNASSNDSSSTKKSSMMNKKKASFVGIKQEHPHIPDSKVPDRPINSINEHHNPVDLATGQELKTMPNVPDH